MDALLRFFRLFRKYLKHYWKGFIILALFLLLQTLFLLYRPKVIGDFVDCVMDDRTVSTMVRLGWLYCIASIGVQAFTILTEVVSRSVGGNASNELRKNLISHCLASDLDFHIRYGPGEMIERIDSDVSVLGRFFSVFSLKVVGAFMTLVGVIWQLSFVRWELGVAFGSYISLLIFVLIVLQKKGVDCIKRARNAKAEVVMFFDEYLIGMDDLRVCDSLSFLKKRFRKLNQHWYEFERKSLLFRQLQSNIGWCSYELIAVIVLLLSAKFYWVGGLTLGAVYLTYRYAVMIREPVEGIVLELDYFQRTIASESRISELLQEPSQMVDCGERPLLGVEPLSVGFKSVSLRLGSGKVILDDVSFFIPAGSRVALVGPTGSGKTTIARLIYRLYEQTAGEISISGVDISRYYLESIQDQIGFIVQGAPPIVGTLRDNLKLNNREVSDRLLISTMGRLGMMKWLEDLPMGLDTELGPGKNSIMISPGESQMLALVRLLNMDVRLLILDEISSHVSLEARQLMKQEIECYSKGKTIISITHHVDFVSNYDQVIEIEEGRVLSVSKLRDLEDKYVG